MHVIDVDKCLCVCVCVYVWMCECVQPGLLCKIVGIIIDGDVNGGRKGSFFCRDSREE